MKSFSFLLLITFWFSGSSTLDITSTFTTDEGLPNNEVRAILNDPTGSIWIGSGSGAAWLEGSHWKMDTREINPVVNGVSTLFKDSRGNLWFGGLNEFHVYEDGAYKTYSILEDLGLSGRVVFSFHEDRDHNIWVGTTGGAAVFDGSNWQTFTTDNGLNNNVIHDIDQDKHGNIWFATRKGGIHIYDGSTWQYWYPDLNARKLFRDKDDTMWIGTSNGLLKFNGTKWQTFEEGKTVLPMFRGDKGFIWCIANGKDIVRIAPDGQAIYYEDPTGGKANEIYHLEYAQDGSVWAGTDQGVFVFH